MSTKYIIQVGPERPKTIKQGTVAKGLGQSVAEEVGELLVKRATCTFPNRALIWGKRVIDGKETAGHTVKVEDDDYRGEIEPMKWGTKGGYPIDVRFLTGYPTLDLIYQNKVLNASENINENDVQSLDTYFINLESGENILDEEIDPLFVMMLRVSHYNANSIYVNPEKMPANPMFTEVAEKLSSVEVDKKLDAKMEAFNIVWMARQDNSLAKVKSLYTIVGDVIHSEEEIKDADLGKYLMSVAEEKSAEFMAAIATYQKNVSADFEKARAFTALDLTKDGIIVVKHKNFTAVIAEGIPAKKEKMVDWIVENFNEPKSFEAAFQLRTAVDKLK